jgi:hypothetical protein
VSGGTPKGTIAHLMRGISPAQLAWLDEQVRRESYDYAWRRLSPETVTRLGRTRDFDLVVIDLFGSHRNGFVRATALDCLTGLRDGREIPILTLRANDWVAPVAARATELLMERLRPDNRHTVLAMLPTIRNCSRHSGRSCCQMVATRPCVGRNVSTRMFGDTCTICSTMLGPMRSGASSGQA